MPLYNYKCNKCERTLEVLERAKNMRPTIPCCCGGTLRRVFSTFNIKPDVRTRDPRSYLDTRGKVPDHDTTLMDNIKAFEKKMRGAHQ